MSGHDTCNRNPFPPFLYSRKLKKRPYCKAFQHQIKEEPNDKTSFITAGHRRPGSRHCRWHRLRPENKENSKARLIVFAKIREVIVMKTRLFGTLTLAALVAAVVAAISYSRNKQIKERVQADYFDRISPYL